MAKSVEAILRKLDKPPAGHNFARSNFQSRARTTSALVNLALGFPTVSYQWALDAIHAQLADKLDDEMALRLLSRNCPFVQLDHNIELLVAFQEYNQIRRFDGLPVFPEFCGQFMAGPDVRVPIKPTALLREGGALKPLFIIPWAHNGLLYEQRRLLASMYEDAIYSLTDLRASNGEVLIFPRNGYGKRIVDRWERDSYQLHSREELKDQIERFVFSRNAARPLIIDRMKAQEDRKQQHMRKGNPSVPPTSPE